MSIRKKIAALLAAIIGGAFISLSMGAVADEPEYCHQWGPGVTVEYRCTTRCVITPKPGGGVAIRDCCGGRVHVIIRRTADQPCLGN